MVADAGLRYSRPASRLPRRVSPPEWTISIVCILVYLFVVHSYKIAIGSHAIVIGLAALAFEGRQVRLPSFLVWFGAFLIWALITLPFGISPENSFERWQDFGKLWLIAFLISNAARSEKQVRIVAVGWLALFALYPFRGTLFNVLGGISTMGRYAWNFTFGNPNDLAAIALFPLALCVALMRTPDSKGIKWCARVGAASIPVLIVLTGSRGGLLALGVFVAILLLFSKRRAGILVLGLLAFTMAMPLMPEAIRERFANMKFLKDEETIGQADSSALQRYKILQVATAIALDHPIFGVGIGNYPVAHAEYALQRPEWDFASGRRDSHNTYLGLLAENGVPGFLLMAGAAASLLLTLLRAHKSANRVLASETGSPGERNALVWRPPALIAGTLAYLAASFFGSFFYLIFPYLFAVTAIGLVGTGSAATARSEYQIRGRRRITIRGRFPREVTRV